MRTSILNWGLLSTARINRALISALRASQRSQLLAVASRSQQAAQAYAAEWGIPRAYGSYEELLADPEIDVIYNPLPNHLHKEWSIRAARAGKHVLCEKPLGLSPAEVDEMAAVVQETGRQIVEAFMYRHHPQTLQVKELVESGAIGRLQLIRGSFTFRMKSDTNIRLYPEMGGGSLWDVGCYPVSYARYLAGAEPEEVFGWQVTGASGVDESFFGQMKFPNGVYAQFDSGFRTPFRAHLEVVGAEGTITIPTPFKPGLNETITLTREDGVQTLVISGQELYLGEVEDLTDCILTGKSPRVSLSESRGNAAALAALYHSARSGRPVRLEEIIR